MIPINIRIYGWILQQMNAHETWSQKKIEAEHDRYLETTMHQYHGINVYAEKMRR